MKHDGVPEDKIFLPALKINNGPFRTETYDLAVDICKRQGMWFDDVHMNNDVEAVCKYIYNECMITPGPVLGKFFPKLLGGEATPDVMKAFQHETTDYFVQHGNIPAKLQTIANMEIGGKSMARICKRFDASRVVDAHNKPVHGDVHGEGKRITMAECFLYAFVKRHVFNFFHSEALKH